MITFLSTYLHKTTHYSAGRFIAEMALIILFLLMVMSLVDQILLYTGMDLLGDYEHWFVDYIKNQSFIKSFLIICLIAPVSESVLLQAVPITITSTITPKKHLQTIISAFIFTMLHGYPLVLMPLLFITGSLFAWSYIVFRKHGWGYAVFITSVIHGIANLLPLLVIYFSK